MGRSLRLGIDRRRVKAITAVIVACSAIFLVLLAVRLHEGQQYSGDEPHYLIVTESLFYDGDVDVKNDYALARYRPFPDPPDVHVNTAIFTASSPHWYSSHGVGLPAVILPGVVVDNARGAAVEMVLAAAVVLTLTFFWARRFGSALAAATATAAVGFSPFFLGLDGRIFPDLPTAALILGCLLVLELREQRLWQLLVLSILAGISPWIHFKNGLAFATIVAIAVVQVLRRSSGIDRLRRLAVVLVPALVSAVCYEISVRDWYGSWLPTRMSPPGRELFAFSPMRGLAAASFDGSHGLLSNNPALILVLAGLPIWFSRSRSSFLIVALALGPTILMQATFNDWSGGYAPSGRYALQFVPAFAPAIVMVLRYSSRGTRTVAFALIGLQWALAAAFIWLRPGWILAGAPSPLLAGVSRHLGVSLGRLVPRFDSGAHVLHGGWQLIGWYCIAFAAVIYGVVAMPRRSS